MAARKKKTTATKLKAAGPRTDAKQYEAMFLFPPPGVVDVDGMIKNAQGIIERHGGKILLIKKWDERKLAYEVKKQKRGTYIVAYYQGPGASVGAIERDVNLSEDILFPRLLKIGPDHRLRIFGGFVAGNPHLLGRPQAQKLVAPGDDLETQFLVMRPFGLERLLAILKRSAHSNLLITNRICAGRPRLARP